MTQTRALREAIDMARTVGFTTVDVEPRKGSHVMLRLRADGFDGEVTVLTTVLPKTTQRSRLNLRSTLRRAYRALTEGEPPHVPFAAQ